MEDLIQPHGGKLISKELSGEEAKEGVRKAKELKKLELAPYEVSDLEMIASGAMSPLEGFMGQEQMQSVLKRMRLPSGLVWSLPVVKSVSGEEKKSLKVGEEVGLIDGESREVLAILKVAEIFPHDKKVHANETYQTEDPAHPGVARILSMEEFLVGGDIQLVQKPKHTKFLNYRRDPKDTRALFIQKKWKRVVAFQTRNPIHRAHEYLTKCALEMTDGLMIHPLVGQTKGDDISAEVRMKCYEVLMEKYYANDRVLLSVFPAAMRYAGPREAIFHAVVRKNYGCTHFIVGRDHAGASKPDGKPYYGSFDAQLIFNNFEPEEIGITPIFFDFTFYCKTCQGMVSPKTCPHDKSHHLSLSGTKVREMLRQGEIPPPEFTRPEVARILIEAMKEKSAVSS
ncbi:MAG: sulfate adenylyltransferase [Candidatus Omnitrophica bacterium]|nr:sulfate adenylyltransferase [Candidatus Omnitrophota bacterium]